MVIWWHKTTSLRDHIEPNAVEIPMWPSGFNKELREAGLWGGGVGIPSFIPLERMNGFMKTFSVGPVVFSKFVVFKLKHLLFCSIIFEMYKT